MYEPSHLIPNMNEMMEAYTEVEEETVQETQPREMQEEEELKPKKSHEARNRRKGQPAETPTATQG